MKKDPPKEAELNILMMPDYRLDNPYQTLLTDALETQGVRINFCQGYRRIFPIYRQLKTVQIISRNPLEILHIHWLNPYLKGENIALKLVYCFKFLLDIFLVKIQGVKIIWTVHNLVAHNSQFPRIEKYLKWIFIRLTNGVIVHSQAAKDSVVDRYGINPNKINVIPHGHYRDAYLPAIAPLEARHQLNLPEQGLIFLNFGMLRPYKGIEKLLEIWHLQAELLTESQLLIVGKALDLDYGWALDTQAKAGRNITLRNQFVANEEVHLYFSAADIIVLPFNQILTSGSLLLAMSYGKPIIAPKSATILETMGEATDFLYDPEDPNGLLQAIQDSLKGDLCLASQKVSRAGDRLNWFDIAAQTKKVYQT
jgi:beta-1,4-mannosyltransferase